MDWLQPHAVGGAGNILDPAHQGESVILGLDRIGAGHLHVNRRRAAEIQDLADDIGRGKEKHCLVEIARQHFA